MKEGINSLIGSFSKKSMAIASIHEDIIRTHILTRLDGQTLAVSSCVSSSLQTLCSDQQLWSNICSSNWPSTDHQLVTRAISTFTSGHRSFFSDTFPSPTNHLTSTVTSSSPTTMIISSVDLKYNDQVVFSMVDVTNTTPTNWFKTSPFRIDLLEPKELIPSSVKLSGDDQVLLSNLEKHITLSWIIIDPIQHRAVNLSSIKPVFVQRNWLTDEIELTFGLVIGHGHDTYVNCNIEITCGVNIESGELYVSGVSLTILDIDGKCLNGKGSMVILQGLTAAERQCNDGGERWKERYDEYVQRRRERKENMEMRERRLDLVCVASGLAFLLAFWSFALY